MPSYICWPLSYDICCTMQTDILIICDSNYGFLASDISPNIVSRQDLAELLSGIRSKNPKSFRLPRQPSKKLREFYRLLTCTTVLGDRRILVILSIHPSDQVTKLMMFLLYTYIKSSTTNSILTISSRNCKIDTV